MNTDKMCQIIYEIDGSYNLDNPYDFQEMASDEAKDAIIASLIDTDDGWKQDASDILCDWSEQILSKIHKSDRVVLNCIKEAVYLYYEARIKDVIDAAFQPYCYRESEEFAADCRMDQQRDDRMDQEHSNGR